MDLLDKIEKKKTHQHLKRLEGGRCITMMNYSGGTKLNENSLGDVAPTGIRNKM